MGGNNGTIANRGVVSNINVVSKYTIEQYFVSNINTLADIYSSPAVHCGSPRFYRSDENEFVEKESPQEFNGVPNSSTKVVETVIL